MAMITVSQSHFYEIEKNSSVILKAEGDPTPSNLAQVRTLDRLISQSKGRPNCKATDFQKAYIEQLYNRMMRLIHPDRPSVWVEKLNKELATRLSRELFETPQRIAKIVTPSFFSKMIHDNLLHMIPIRKLGQFLRIFNGRLELLTFRKNRWVFAPYKGENLSVTVDGFVANTVVLKAPMCVTSDRSQINRLQGHFQLSLVERKMPAFFAGSPHCAIGLVEPWKGGVGKTLIGYTFDKGCCKNQKEEFSLVTDPMMPALLGNPKFRTISESYTVKSPEMLVQWKEFIYNLPKHLNQVEAKLGGIRHLALLSDKKERWAQFLGLLADAGPLRRQSYQKILENLKPFIKKIKVNPSQFKKIFQEVLQVAAKVHKDPSLTTNCRYLAKRSFRVIHDLVDLERVTQGRVALHQRDIDRNELRQHPLWRVVVLISDLIAWVCDFIRDLFTSRENHEKRATRAVRANYKKGMLF